MHAWTNQRRVKEGAVRKPISEILTARVLAISAAQGRMHTLAGREQNANAVRIYGADSLTHGVQVRDSTGTQLSESSVLSE